MSGPVTPRLAVALVLAWLPAASIAQQSAPADSLAQVDRLFARWQGTESPGCAVGVARDGRPVLARAYGMANLEYDVPNTTETVFEAGSVSKQFTAAAVALLAQQGKLSLDDPVRKYIPELPDYGTPLTIRQMLNHTSGLRDWGVVVSAAGWPRGSRVHTHAHVLDVMSRQKALNFPPGSEYLYSNTNYNLSAIIVDRVSGMPFAEFTRKNIFEPLGMSHTQWRDDFTRIVKHRATAYASAGSGGYSLSMPFENVHGNGGLLTTVGDLLRWNENFTDPKVGGRALVDELQRRGRLKTGGEIRYALGLVVSTLRGLPEVSHDGATAGYRAFLARYPEQRLSVALLCNAGNVNPSAIGRQVAGVFLGGASRPPTPAAVDGVTLSAAELSALTGLYRNTSDNVPLTLSAQDGKLRVEGGPLLSPISRTTFRDESGAGEVIFALGPNGVPTAVLRPGPDGDTTRYVPVAAWKPTAAQLAEYAGEYVSDEAEVTYRVAVEAGKLVVRRRPNDVVELTPSYRDALWSPRSGLVWFRRDAKGRVTGLSLGLGRVRELQFRRVSRPAGAS